MRNYVQILISAFVVLYSVSGNLFAQSVFFEKYPKAQELVATTYARMKILNELGEEGKLIYAMAAPEVAMYNEFYDMMETGASEIFYINWGEEYANFSLGIFQMKPSFAESVERRYLKNFPNGIYAVQLKYTDTAVAEVRYQRIERLKSEEWQQIYLICCYRYLEAKYKYKFSDPKERISFFAAAYNYGWESSFAEIQQWQTKISFPGRGKEPVISYADLSRQLAEQLLPESYFMATDKSGTARRERVNLVMNVAEKRTPQNKEPLEKGIPQAEEKTSKLKPVFIFGIAFSVCLLVLGIFFWRKRRPAF